jgi:CRP-like cAMP-binding protein
MASGATPEDRRQFRQAMTSIAPLSERELARGLALVTPRTLAKGAHFLRAGARATQLAVVVQGMLREYFLMRDGSERSKAFIVEGRVSGSLADLLSPAPSRAFIVAEEPARLLVVPYESLQSLGRSSAAWARLGRAALEQLLLQKAAREWELLGLDAAQRYDAFRARYPGLEARVLGRHVASYLGITAVHLSRLRRLRTRKA